MKEKVLLTRQIKNAPGVEDALREEFRLIERPDIGEKEIISLAGDIDGIVAPHTKINEAIIKAAPLLRVIATPQVGFENINIAVATRYNIPVVASIGVAAETVAEYTLGLMIGLARRITRADRDLKEKKDWSAREPYGDPSLEMGTDVTGLTVGLVGLGAIGREVARICRAALSSRVLAYDPFVSKENMEALGVEKRDNLTEMAGEVDFLSLHMGLSKDTRHIINGTVLRSMKPGAYLINCARGGVVDEGALVRALEEKWIAGAAVDCFEAEPISPDNPLLDMPSVILTPHLAGITTQACLKRGLEMIKNIKDVRLLYPCL